MHDNTRMILAFAGPVLLLGGAALLSGCVAALLPLAAAGVYGGKELLGDDLDDRSDRRIAATGTNPLAATATAVSAIENGRFEILDIGKLPPPTARDLGLTVSRALPEDALDSETFLTGFLQRQGERQRAGIGGESVVLMPDTDPASPQVTICEDLPYAFLVELDAAAASLADEGAPSQLIPWVRAARDAGIDVIFTVDSGGADAKVIERALADAGLGLSEHGKTLWLAGDKRTVDLEALRWKIASNYCVIAITADRPADFTQLYGRFPDETMRASNIASLWNAGWFLSPEPLALAVEPLQSTAINADNGDTP